MKHINFSKWLKELLRDGRNNFLILLLYLLIFPILIFLYLLRRIKTTIVPYGVDASLADCFVFVTDKFFFALFIIPISVFLLQHLKKNDSNIFVIIRQRSRQLVWIKEVFKTFIFSLCLATYFIICTFIMGSFCSTSFFNWNRSASVYYLANNSVADNISLLNIIVIFFIFCVQILFVMNTLFQLILWITNKYVLGWIVILSIGVWDMFQQTYPVIYGRLTITHSIWERSDLINISILYGILVGLAIFLFGKSIVKRKDFLNETG